MTDKEIQKMVQAEAFGFQRSFLTVDDEGTVDYVKDGLELDEMLALLRGRMDSAFPSKSAEIEQSVGAIKQACLYQAPEMLPMRLGELFYQMAQELLKEAS